MTTDPKDTTAPDPEENAAPETPEVPEAPEAPEEAVTEPEAPAETPAAAPEPAEEEAPAPAEADETTEDGGEFAEMLEAAANAEPAEASPGDKVTGRIVQIDGPDAFVDCGLRNELPIAVEELKSGPDAPAPQVGDEVTAYVQKAADGLKLTMAVKLKDAGREALTAAYAAGTPVQGKVLSTNKGGFSVDLDGTWAF